MTGDTQSEASIAFARSLAGWLASVVAAGTIIALPYAWWRYGGGGAPVLVAFGIVGSILMADGRLARLDSRSRVTLFAAFGVLLRLGMTAVVSASQPSNDPLSYRTLAQSVIDGHGLVAWGVKAHYPPLYPLLLAGLGRACGSLDLALALLNLVIDAGGALLLVMLGRRFMDHDRAVLAAGILFLWPPFVAAFPVAQKEGLTLLLALAAMEVCLHVSASVRPWRWSVALGLLWGLLVLTQPALAALPIMLIAAAMIGRRLTKGEGIASLSIAGVAAMTIVAPWWIRNWNVLGGFVPLTSAGGLALLGPVPQLSFNGAPLGEAAEAKRSLAQALAWIAAHPLAYGARASSQFGRAMLFDIGGMQQYFWFVPQPPKFFSVAVMTACQLAWIALCVRVARAARKGSQALPGELVLLLGAVTMQLLLVNGWLQFHERHRYLLTPLLILLVAWAQAAGPRDHREARAPDQ